MKEVFFNEDGSLKINETIMSQPSFVKISVVGVVTVDELKEQNRRMLSIFRKIEDTFNDEQKMLVQELLVESNVLNAIFKQHGMQVAME